MFTDSTQNAADLIDELQGSDLLDDSDKVSNHRKLELAKAALELALALTREVAKDTNDEHAKAYFVDHLAILASNNHGFLSRDFNIDDWIEQAEAGDDAE